MPLFHPLVQISPKMTEQVFCLIVLLVAVLHVNTECPPSTGMTTTNDTHTVDTIFYTQVYT